MRKILIGLDHDHDIHIYTPHPPSVRGRPARWHSFEQTVEVGEVQRRYALAVEPTVASSLATHKGKRYGIPRHHAFASQPTQ